MKDKGQVVAYLRVSSEGQSLERQEDLKENTDRVFLEKASAGTAERPVLKEMQAYVREGDTVRVWSMDRLARSLMDLQNIVQEFTERGVTVEFVKEELTFQPDTKSNPYAKFQFQVLGAVAELERAIIRARQAEGIAKAKAKGVYKGRKRVLVPEQIKEAKEWIALGVPKAQVARDLGIARQTLYRALSELEAA